MQLTRVGQGRAGDEEGGVGDGGGGKHDGPPGRWR